MKQQTHTQPLQYEPLTLDLALNTQEFHENGQFDSTGHCRVWRRNGQTKTWKRNPSWFSIPVKHGLYQHAYIANDNAHLMHTPETCPHATPEQRANARTARLQAFARAHAQQRLQEAIATVGLAFDEATGEWFYPDGSSFEYTTAQLRGF